MGWTMPSHRGTNSSYTGTNKEKNYPNLVWEMFRPCYYYIFEVAFSPSFRLVISPVNYRKCNTLKVNRGDAIQ